MAVFRCVLTGRHFGSIVCQNVLAFKWPDFAGDPIQVCNELVAGWIECLRVGQTTQFAWTSVSAVEVGSPNSPTLLPINVVGQDGSDQSAAVPAVTQKFRILTGIAGRKGRGRIYIPGFRQAYWQFGQLTATGVTNMSIRVNCLKTRYVGIGATGPMHLGVLARGAPEADFIAATDLVLSSTPGIQRRRNLGVGV